MNFNKKIYTFLLLQNYFFKKFTNFQEFEIFGNPITNKLIIFYSTKVSKDKEKETNKKEEIISETERHTLQE